MPNAAHEAEPGTPEPVAAAVLDLNEVKALWPAVLQTLSQRNQLLHSVITPALPTALSGHDLVLSYDASQAFFRRKAEAPAARAELAEVVRSLAGFQPRLTFELADTAALPDMPPPVQISEAEWVERFKQEFDAQEIDPEETA